jgi:hypothetical protein
MSRDNVFNPLSDITPSLADLKDALNALDNAADNAKAKVASAKASLETLEALFVGDKGIMHIPEGLTEAPADWTPPAEFAALRAFLNGLDGGDSSHPVELAAMKAHNDVIDAYAHKVIVEDAGSGE